MDALYPPEDSERSHILTDGIPTALERLRRCFDRIVAKYYSSFDPWRGSHYAIFLYYLSNSLLRAGHARAGEKVYLLNRALHAVDILHEVDLPDVWMLDHPLGTVIGRAKYGSHFIFSQNCTVGNINGVYPAIGRGVMMSSRCSILGRSSIGDCCILGSGALVKNTDIPPFSLVFGESPNLTIKRRDASYFRERYQSIWVDAEEIVAHSSRSQ
jgi:serine O-acetyltransferase